MNIIGLFCFTDFILYNYSNEKRLPSLSTIFCYIFKRGIVHRAYFIFISCSSIKEQLEANKILGCRSQIQLLHLSFKEISLFLGEMGGGGAMTKSSWRMVN